MDHDEIKFELLKRWGNVKEVNRILSQQETPEEERVNPLSEAYLHDIIRNVLGVRSQRTGYENMREDGLDNLLNVKEVNQFLEVSNDWDILTEFVAGLGDQFEEYVANPPMETYVPMYLLRLLNYNPLVEAIRKGAEENPNLRSALKRTIKRGYQIIFSRDIDDDMFAEYNPMLARWNGFIDPFEAVVLAAGELSHCFYETDEIEYQRNKIEKAVPVLVELTDEQTVALALYVASDNSEGYRALVDLGITQDGSEIDDSDKETKINDIRKKDHHDIYPFAGISQTDELEEALASGEDFSERFGDWFKDESMGYIFRASSEHGERYDHEKARQSLGVAIADSVKEEDWDKLKWVIEFPSDLIDDKNPNLTSLVEAYNLTKDTS